ncbi:MAG: peptidylprolyl isomerase [Rhodothermales bacterium]|nr:peptidylprolyl isomerase [Rhodothermales bacterium]MBO6779304.1 peptidylprolyl isomerase [Rhodothermales bacterium]
MALSAPESFDIPGDGDLFVRFNTSAGTITARLFEQEAPRTVANFVGLATGTAEWREPQTGDTVQRPFYDGLVFHRVIPEFMIQFGCPLGTGTGGPGYRFKDEFAAGLRHDKPGMLSMANAGPHTNGSQFFITEVPTPWLDGKHAIFGEVTEGGDLIAEIAAAGNHSTTMESVEIFRA